MLPSEIGDRAEAAVLAALIAAGKRVLVPFGQCRYDLAFEQAGRLVKVQCKAGRLRAGVLTFRTHSVGRRSLRDYHGDCEHFGVYCHERREVYLVPVADVPNSRASLRVAPTRNGQAAGVRWAAPYLLAEEPEAGTGGLDRQLSILTDVDICGNLSSMTDSPLGTLPVACCTPLAAPRLTDDEAEATAAIFKALADPHRVRIVNLLANADGPVCVCEITPALGLSQPTTSFHLKKLQNAGLITREQRGTWAYYEIDRAALDKLTSVVDLSKGAFV